MKKILIAPSILSADLGCLNEEIVSVEQDADILHIDIMDGHFVPNLTFGPPVVKYIKSKLPLDCHLMVEHPENYLEELAKYRVNQVSVHWEACPNLHRVLMKIKELGMKAGVAINPATPVNDLKDILEMIDFVLVMSVNPGFGGQVFIDHAVEKIRELRQMDSRLIIEVDGGINENTAGECVRAGVDILVAGSYIFNTNNRGEIIRKLRQKF